MPQHQGEGRLIPERMETRRTSSRDNREGGFTLIELLVVIAIMPLVVGAITVGLLTIIKNGNTTTNRVSDSQDTTTVSANFVQDVQGASAITTSNSVTSPPPCGPVSAALGPLPAQPILSLQWTASSTLYVVSYAVEQSGSTYRLVRSLCQNSSTTPSTVRVLSRDVQSNLLPVITGVSCTGLSCPNAATAAAAGWTPTAGVSGVTLGVTAQLAGDSSYQYRLVGVPRVTTSASRGAPVAGHPTALSLSASGTSVTCGGNGNLSVTGSLAINSNAATVGSTNGNGSVTADQIYTNSTSSTALSGHFTPSTPTQSPVVTPDPFATLPPPATGLATATLTVGGTYQGFNVYGGTYTGPGIYKGTLSFPNGSTTMASGVYILMNGISLSGNQSIASATTGGADGKGGVLLYVYRGTVSLTGNGSATLSPFITPPASYPTSPNPWPGIAIWQDAGDANAVGLAGNGSGNVIGGTVYAPDATVGGTGNGSLTVGSIVADALTCGGNGAINVG